MIKHIRVYSAMMIFSDLSGKVVYEREFEWNGWWRFKLEDLIVTIKVAHMRYPMKLNMDSND